MFGARDGSCQTFTLKVQRNSGKFSVQINENTQT